MENKNFLKVGEKVVFKPKTEGLDYDMESGKVYTVQIDHYTDEISFNVAPDITLPEKLYTTAEDDKFVTKVIDRYTTIVEGTVGVMLSGLKGSGKTIMMKRLALESKLPILLIDKGFSPRDLVSLFNKLEDKAEVKPLTDFIQEKFGCISFDNIASFADEVNAYPNDTYEDLFNDMNLSNK